MDKFKIIKNSRFFKALQDAEINHIIDNSTVKSAKKGMLIHDTHEVCKNITVILEGKAYSSNYSLNGNEQIICSFEKGMVFGFPIVFGDMTYPENIFTETDCRLLYISRDTLMQLFNNKEFLMDFIKKLAQKVKDFSNLVEILSYTSVKERVAKYILGIAKTYDLADITLSKNKTRLAKELGTSRVVVSRTFKALEDEHIIERKSEKHIVILDIAALQLFS